MIVNKYLVNFGNIGNPGNLGSSGNPVNPGNRGAVNYGHPAIFQELRS